MGDISSHFSLSEFACQDNCGFGKNPGDVSPNLIEVLEEMRVFIGPMTITSGCRCKAHNDEIGGSKGSAHLYGLAADIKCPDSHRAFEIVHEAMWAGLRRIGIERGCIHVDVSARPEHPQDVLFGWDRTQHQGVTA